MPKAISNIDTKFFEDTTAQISRARELCETLAQQLDRPEELATLKIIYGELLGIRANIINQRQKIRASHDTGRPLVTSGASTRDNSILPQPGQRQKSTR